MVYTSINKYRDERDLSLEEVEAIWENCETEQRGVGSTMWRKSSSSKAKRPAGSVSSGPTASATPDLCPCSL